MYLFIFYILKLALVYSAESRRYENIAKLKASSQSSISGSSNPASLAVDDSIQTCSRTATGKNESWLIDLEQNYIISALVINTGISYFGPQFEIYISKFESAKLLCNFGRQLDEEREHNISCLNGPIEGRFVTIVNTFSGGVRLCDVQVLVCNDGYFGSSCIFDCHCNNNDLCSKDSGICSNTCASGWTGVNCQDECARGYFGINCQNSCHCENNSPCDMIYGYCPSKCAQNWLGLACQTKLPLLSDQPLLISSHVADISIKWLSWNEFIDLSFTLLYQVEYKLYDLYANDTYWVEGPILVDGIDKWEQSTIVNLEMNSFYEFRILPIIRMEDNTEIKGEYGMKSPVFRTKCTAPEMPNITMISMYIDEMQKPGFKIEWKSLTRKESNCDSIQYYKIIYKCSSETNPKVEYALQSVSNKNVSNIKFDEECWVVLVVINNQDLGSSSLKQQIITSKSPTYAPTSYRNSISFGIFMGIFVCSVLVFFIFISALLFRNIQKSYNKVPGNNFKNDNIKAYNSTRLRNCNSLQFKASDLSTPFLNEHLPSDSFCFQLECDQPLKTTISLNKSPIKIKDLEEYIIVGKANYLQIFKDEYLKIPLMNMTSTQKDGSQIGNCSKNQFSNILPYDHSRVVLNSIEGDVNSNYINASFIDGYKKSNAYIATQGCKKSTINDMWRLIWHVNCSKIVMLTQLFEMGKKKCEQYWPDDEYMDTSYGEIIVNLIEVKKCLDFIIRTFLVKKNDEIRKVRQFHYLSWPDHGVPNRFAPIIQFRRIIHSENDQDILVIHCSAGVGRTGAFIAFDYLMEEAKAEKQVDIIDCVKLMRQNRMYMVQNLKQYVFIYEVLLEAIIIGCTAIPCNKFSDEFNYLINSKEEHLSLLEKQYQTLNEVSYKENHSDYNTAYLPENIKKNRSNILPADKHRPYLNTNILGTNNYINAIFVDGYFHKNAYLLTQMPLPDTVIDLWRLVFEQSCNTIVMLNEFENETEIFCKYWPEKNDECKCGPFNIECDSIEVPYLNITVRKLKLSISIEGALMPQLKEDENIRYVTMLQLGGWESNLTCPPSYESIIHLLNLTTKSQNVKPLIIHCRDGSKQSGLFCIILYILERLKCDQEVDIFNAIKHFRYYRPSVITNYDQYKFLYEIINQYLNDLSKEENLIL